MKCDAVSIVAEVSRRAVVASIEAGYPNVL